MSNSNISRRVFLQGLGTSLPVLSRPANLLFAADSQTSAPFTITKGDFKVVLRDNSESPAILSGVDSLFHLRDAPNFDAFDPDSKGASAGLNFEHIIAGHKSPNNAFTPRRGRFAMTQFPDQNAAELVRLKQDDPWAMSSTIRYAVTAPHSIDVDFRCMAHDQAIFGEHGYAVLFFANYMNDVQQVALNFWGIEGPHQNEKWIAADAPQGHPDWNKGGTYRSSKATDLTFDADHNFKLNLWSYDYPRFTKPFYFGHAANDMVLIMMFDRILSADDEIRFSLFKFKLPRLLRPAWDFQYVIHNIQAQREYGFKARLVWKKFVSPEDCLQEYERWTATI